MRILLAAWLAGCQLGPQATVTAPADGPRHFVVYSLWLQGQEAHRDELDRFTRCLVDGSTFADFWYGAVTLEVGGSFVVPPPAEGTLAVDQTDRWLLPMLEGLTLPPLQAGATPLYVVYGDAGQTGTRVCGQCNAIEVGGRAAGLAVVRTTPPCWPAQGPVRGLTQFTQHELSCAIELGTGEDHCAADGACEARGNCPDPCSNFTGLYCEGAPESSYTGCDGTPVRGWVVQKLSHKGVGTDECPICTPCDFQVEAREPPLPTPPTP